jgi:SAM-dependent methyltransferase
VNPDQIAFLRSEPGITALAEVDADEVTGDRLLATVERLRRRFTPEQAAAVAETVSLRSRAVEKFAAAFRMLFTSDALEQATHEAVAAHRASRFPSSPDGIIADLGCGAGGDALALARIGRVVGVDRDPVRLLLARHNLAAAGLGAAFGPVLADIGSFSASGLAGAFADPARRSSGRRLLDPEAASPPLSILRTAWVGSVPVTAVKVAPGIAHEAIPARAQAEFVSLDGTMKEAVLWWGESFPPGRRATVLPGPHVLEPDGGGAAAVSKIGAFLHEPDPAVIRAGLVSTLARRIGADLIDPEIAYLTGADPVSGPFSVSYAVEEVLPFNLKLLRRRLRELDVGIVDIKKRGSPLTPEELRPRLRLEGGERKTVVLTRASGNPVAVIARPVQSGRA